MMKIKKLLYSFIAIVLTGCGGSGSSSGGSAVSGTVVDGYLKEATVCIDLNHNNNCDQNEPTTTTGVNGTFSFTNLSQDLGTQTIIAYGGVDTAVNRLFTGMFSRTIDLSQGTEVNITPITTLVDRIVRQENKSENEAKDIVSSNLGISSDSLYDDPMLNLTVFKKTQELVQSINLIRNDLNSSTDRELFGNIMGQFGNSMTYHSGSFDINRLIEDTNSSVFGDTTINISDELEVSISNIVNTIENTSISTGDNLESLQRNWDNQVNNIDYDPVESLNILRENCGLNRLVLNEDLKESATNHTNYLVATSTVGHYELDDSVSEYTGYAPVDRTIYAGYDSRAISENLSVGQPTQESSLDGLMGAIYHRFAFLSFSINEIGYGYYDRTYVYNMGNFDLNTLCKGESYTGSGAYYYDVCADSSFKIEKSLYDDTLNQTINNNPNYVIYPYGGEEGITPAFFEETPDPLADYDVSGYPVSIEFNKNTYDSSLLQIDSFELFDSTNTSVELINYSDGSTILSSENDPNSELSDYQFVIFSKDRLKYNETYRVKLVYSYDGTSHTIEWNFKTKELPNLIDITTQTDIDIALGTTYNIYFEPRDKTDIINRYTISCTYQSGGEAKPYVDFYDQNTLSINISGSLVNSCTLNLDSEDRLTLNIQ